MITRLIRLNPKALRTPNHISQRCLSLTTSNLNSKKDFYQLLKIERQAKKDEIRQAFKSQAVKYHPDAIPEDDPDKAEKEEYYKTLSEAYETLMDPATRRKYDALNPMPTTKRKRTKRDGTSDIRSKTDRGNDFLNRMSEAESSYYEQEDFEYMKELDKEAFKHSDKGLNAEKEFLRKRRMLHSVPNKFTFSGAENIKEGTLTEAQKRFYNFSTHTTKFVLLSFLGLFIIRAYYSRVNYYDEDGNQEERLFTVADGHDKNFGVGSKEGYSISGFVDFILYEIQKTVTGGRQKRDDEDNVGVEENRKYLKND